MKKIMHLFRRDLQNVGHSVIGLIVVVGLVVVPCLYAWFNIAGSWDPYGNTGNLKIAVVNNDNGYKSDLIPVEVNIGENVTASLRANDNFDWTFVSDKDAAIEGVKSGKYYAAVVIPKSFSSDMMTLFSTKVKHADIKFYENQKSNAIAQIVTEKGSTAVQSQVNAAFTKTITSIGLKTTSNLLDYMSSDEMANYVANLSSMLSDSIQDLKDVGESTASLSSVLTSTSDTLSSTSDLVSSNGVTSDDTKALISNAKDGVSDISSALSGATDAVNKAITGSTGSIDNVQTAVDSAFEAGTSHVDTTVSQLDTAKSALDKRASEMRSAQKDLESLADEVRSDTDIPEKVREELANELAITANSIGSLASSIEGYAAACGSAATSLKSSSDDISASRSEINATIAEAKKGVSQAKSDYETTLKSQTDQLSNTISGIVSSSSDISGNLDSAVSSLSGSSTSLVATLAEANAQVQDASSKLTTGSQKLEEFKTQLDTAVASGDLTSIKALIGSDVESLAEALTAPVGLDRKPVYHIRNYGSAMAPFYTILSLWVGSIVLAAMMKVTVTKELVAELIPVRLHEIYLGRYLLFGLLALCQSTLVCMGDILFFGIQCDHPFQFILAAWVASIVFSNIVYTLTVSFGDIGKALAVVLLVMQVGGSGGTFPIEMTGPVFQAIYPFLPFTHGINAMHAAQAGSFGMEYWIELGVLALYLVPSLALGIVFRRPVIRANNWIIEKLEATKLM